MIGIKRGRGNFPKSSLSTFAAFCQLKITLAGDAETGAQAERKGHADESSGLRRRKALSTSG